MGLNLVLNFREPDPLPGYIDVSLLPVLTEWLVEVRSWVVFVTVRLDASVNVPPSIRSTSSGMCVHENVNVNNSLPSARENKSESVKGVENVSDCERVVHGDVPLREMFRSKEE